MGAHISTAASGTVYLHNKKGCSLSICNHNSQNSSFLQPGYRRQYPQEACDWISLCLSSHTKWVSLFFPKSQVLCTPSFTLQDPRRKHRASVLRTALTEQEHHINHALTSLLSISPLAARRGDCSAAMALVLHQPSHRSTCSCSSASRVARSSSESELSESEELSSLLWLLSVLLLTTGAAGGGGGGASAGSSGIFANLISKTSYKKGENW